VSPYSHAKVGVILMGRTKLPIQARLIRAGIYALLVAMSYWVRYPSIEQCSLWKRI
jgi:hypothetical protein